MSIKSIRVAATAAFVAITVVLAMASCSNSNSAEALCQEFKDNQGSGGTVGAGNRLSEEDYTSWLKRFHETDDDELKAAGIKLLNAAWAIQQAEQSGEEENFAAGMAALSQLEPAMEGAAGVMGACARHGIVLELQTDDTVGDNQDAASGDTKQQADDGNAALGTRDNPLALGTTIEMGDWTLAITDVTLAATDKVLNENPFNEKPVKGRQFVMFSVKATYQGKESGTAWMDFSWAIVGNKGNTFGGASMDDTCGVIPNPLNDSGETFPSGKVRGNVCYSVPSNQIDGATIRIEESFSIEDSHAFFALQ